MKWNDTSTKRSTCLSTDLTDATIFITTCRGSFGYPDAKLRVEFTSRWGIGINGFDLRQMEYARTVDEAKAIGEDMAKRYDELPKKFNKEGK